MQRLLRIAGTLVAIGLIASPASADIAAMRMLTKIDWNAAELAKSHIDRTGQSIVDQFIANTVNGGSNTKLPILIAGNETETGVGRFAGQGTSYAVTYTLDRAKLSIFGSATMIVAPSGMRFEHNAANFESIGDGADYSFTRFGASYTLRLTCDEPLKDKRCTGPEYLTATAANLIVAGGKP